MSPWEDEEIHKEKEDTRDLNEVKNRENLLRKHKQQFQDVNYALASPLQADETVL